MLASTPTRGATTAHCERLLNAAKYRPPTTVGAGIVMCVGAPCTTNLKGATMYPEKDDTVYAAPNQVRPGL